MRFSCLGFFVVLILAMQTVFAQENADIDSLIKEISNNTQQNAFSNYSYKMEFIRQKKALIGKNKLIRRFDVVLPSRMPKNRNYQHRLLLVYDNTRRLSQSEINSRKRDIIKDLEKTEVEIDSTNDQENTTADNTGGYLTLRADTLTSKRSSVGVDLLKLIKNAKFSNYKETKINGRKTISLDFQPTSENALGGDLFYLGRIEGIILIDKEDKRIIEVEAFPIGKLNEYQNKSDKERESFRVFHYQQTRVEEGFWFPKLITLNFTEFADKFDDTDVKIEFTFSKYQRFSVSVDNYNPKPIRRPEQPKSRGIKPNHPSPKPNGGENN